MQEKVMEQTSVLTQRLYYENSKMKEFTARAVSYTHLTLPTKLEV